MHITKINEIPKGKLYNTCQDTVKKSKIPNAGLGMFEEFEDIPKIRSDFIVVKLCN